MRTTLANVLVVAAGAVVLLGGMVTQKRNEQGPANTEKASIEEMSSHWVVKHFVSHSLDLEHKCYQRRRSYLVGFSCV
jgi:hypothetical protein